MENKIKDDYSSFRIDIIGEAIRSQQFDMLNVAKEGMLQLFWNTGKLINEATALQDQNFVKELASVLEVKYGRYFSLPALAQMQEFARICPPEEILLSICHNVGWKHIPVLNKLAKPSEWVYYAELVFKYQINPSELEEEIKQKDLTKNSSMSARRFDKALMERYRQVFDLDQFFKNDKHSIFRNLFELKAIEDTLTGTELVDQTMHMIDLEVDKFRKVGNTVINAIGNYTWGHIGENIASARVALAGETSLETILKSISERLNGNISTQWLEQQLKIYERVKAGPSTNSENNTQVIKEGNVTTTVISTAIGEDFNTAPNIYKNPDIMYFLEQA
ncbi:DUF1016 N-terminal domain-containing protein [Pedobacter montanisoli]|uniref:DUF1016 N-terminal domain-containing protein n=1 Tax=Pedobacter montanisoli TaxID=2923277 RepID=A0ABS9ZZH6_9SPHI|nr:DUF1016 N-terminal domain-containing protein [Pedobacter montanisoli]MCJ0743703.1 DUF1016 N-terminal domain-containing protein [Pedobacter montanisoli]